MVEADGRTESRRVAVVTGASRGIGRAIVDALAEAGTTVVLVGRDLAVLETAAAELSLTPGARSLAVAADISDEDQVARLLERVMSDLGRVDILVNNSGIMVEGPFLEVDQADFDRVIATNLRGTVLCCRAFGAQLTGQGYGKVVNVASNLGIAAVPGAAAYCASKAAVIGLTKALALEWARFGVQVNAVAPGYVETDMNMAVRADRELYGQIVGRIPARRFGLPREVGALVRHLTGPDSDFLTGECVVIDGGQLAKA